MPRLDPAAAAEQMRAAGLEPLETYPGSAKKWHCRCTTCGQEVWPRHSSINQGRGGCNYCAKVASSNASRLDPDVAVAEMCAAGLEPREPYTSSRARWLCRCTTCGREAYTSHSNIKQGHGCKACEASATTGRGALGRCGSSVTDAIHMSPPIIMCTPSKTAVQRRIFGPSSVPAPIFPTTSPKGSVMIHDQIVSEFCPPIWANHRRMSFT